MQTESTRPVRMVRWLGALTFLAAPFALASGCTAGEVNTEQTATAEQTLTTCMCRLADLCGTDDCSARVLAGGGKCPTTCKAPSVFCNVKTDVSCTSSTGHAGECVDGRCILGTCSTCYSGNTCVKAVGEEACGSDGVECAKCDDRNPCTLDECYTETFTKGPITYCRHTPLDGEECPDGRCAGATCCPGCITESRACVFPEDLSAAECGLGGRDCMVCKDTDDNPCTGPICTEAGKCDMEDLPKGASCADTKVCNGTEKCDGSGECLSGTKLDCDDGNPCTTETCSEPGGCTEPVPNPGGECSDGNACTVNDSCNEDGVCQPGSPVPCNDSEPCTTDSCNKETGECVHEPLADDEECDDGNGCTDNDKCTSGKCAGEGVTCEEHQGPCWLATCSEDVCAYDSTTLNGEPCLSDLCKVGQVCEGGDCTGGEDKDCSDNNPCTADTCEGETGKCVNTPISADCSDGNPCTLDDACNDEGECVGTDVQCTASDECHSAGSCDEDSGLCSDLRKPDHTPCAGGECINGSCQPIGAAGAGGADGTGGTSGTGGVTEGGSGPAEGGSDVGMGGSIAHAGAESATGGHISAAGSGTVSAAGSGTVSAAGSGTVSAAGSDNTTGGRPTTGDDDDDTAAAGSDNATGGRPTTSDDDDDTTTSGRPATGDDDDDNATAGRGSSDDDDDVAGSAGQTGKTYERNPGGCSCRMSTDEPKAGWLALALGLAALGRRRRR
ncbi:MAG: MYXO-CTERM sorting domain-containing protein [Polyangiaceae bacterium]|nr:MYXO-CTERM sorting domain-containing protein [Polyangiaceae bacterium]